MPWNSGVYSRKDSEGLEDLPVGFGIDRKPKNEIVQIRSKGVICGEKVSAFLEGFRGSGRVEGGQSECGFSAGGWNLEGGQKNLFTFWGTESSQRLQDILSDTRRGFPGKSREKRLDRSMAVIPEQKGGGGADLSIRIFEVLHQGLGGTGIGERRDFV